MSHTITVRPRKRLGGEQRRALRLLACNPFGVTEAIMHLHGFTRPMLATLVRAGLATVQSETGKAIAVGRIRIMDAGRRWLEDVAKSELRVLTGSRISGGSEIARALGIGRASVYRVM